MRPALSSTVAPTGGPTQPGLEAGLLGTPAGFIFSSPLGRMAIAWTEQGIRALSLPGPDDGWVWRELRVRAGPELETRIPPTEVQRVAGRIVDYLQGSSDPLRDIKLSPATSWTPFVARVYDNLRETSPGDVLTYGELAQRAGAPGAARAVGAAMARNPLPLLIPCHRVVGVQGLGNYSAHGGTKLKQMLLDLEQRGG